MLHKNCQGHIVRKDDWLVGATRRRMGDTRVELGHEKACSGLALVALNISWHRKTTRHDGGRVNNGRFQKFSKVLVFGLLLQLPAKQKKKKNQQMKKQFKIAKQKQQGQQNEY